jgi:hypothetical protein
MAAAAVNRIFVLIFFGLVVTVCGTNIPNYKGGVNDFFKENRVTSDKWHMTGICLTSTTSEYFMSLFTWHVSREKEHFGVCHQFVTSFVTSFR